jgi:hypothetical protein
MTETNLLRVSHSTGCSHPIAEPPGGLHSYPYGVLRTTGTFPYPVRDLLGYLAPSRCSTFAPTAPYRLLRNY